MARYAQGDGAAFVELYDALSQALFGMLLRLARQRPLAEDLLQQTFLQMHDARGRFVPGSPVRPWAYAIARRLFIDHTRRSRREVASGDPPAGPSEPAEHRTPGDWHDAREAAQRAQAALDSLPPRQREAYLLVKVEGLGLSDAADVLGATVTAVKLRVHRAVTALRATLGEDTDSNSTGDT
jgi:RNA polymerase sigma-70 factor (ECF subfamily)